MPHVYQITVGGHLDPDWSEEFKELTIIHCSDGASLLAGPLVDESVLYEVLRKVRDLGLPLLALIRLEPDEPPA